MKIDVAVLSHGIPFGSDVLDAGEADEWATRINDNLAGIIDRYIYHGNAERLLNLKPVPAGV